MNSGDSHTQSVGHTMREDPSVCCSARSPEHLDPKNSNLPTEHTTADSAVVGPVHEDWIWGHVKYLNDLYEAQNVADRNAHREADSASRGPAHEGIADACEMRECES